MTGRVFCIVKGTLPDAAAAAAVHGLEIAGETRERGAETWCYVTAYGATPRNLPARLGAWISERERDPMHAGFAPGTLLWYRWDS